MQKNAQEVRVFLIQKVRTSLYTYMCFVWVRSKVYSELTGLNYEVQPLTLLKLKKEEEKIVQLPSFFFSFKAGTDSKPPG